MLAHLKDSPMPPAPLLWLVVVSLFLQISLLELVMVRWCLNAVSMPGVLHSTVIFGTDVVSFGVQDDLFGMLVASTLAPLGTIERCRGT